MGTWRNFEIHYRFNGTHYRFNQRDRTMTDTDAWHYAALHCGVYLGPQLNASETGVSQLKAQAEGGGLTDVQWHEVAGASI